jgi:phosphate transport system substrate-binding protein
MMSRSSRLASGFLVGSVALALAAACGNEAPRTANETGSTAGMPLATTTAPASGASQALEGTILIDGSSTVFPITQAVAEEFRVTHRNVQIPVGISGTGGGFKRFIAGETAINDASRPIKASEAEQAKNNGVEYVELRVAFDGLSVVVNRANTFVDCLTTDELKKIWEPGSTINNWNQVRPDFPDQKLTLYGPGTDSGTFDYFTEVINGKEDASRSDFAASEDDNILVLGIAGDRNALGYFGYAYYAENADKLKVLGVDNGRGCIRPSAATINDGTYAPLSRPMFIYVNRKALERPEVREFVVFYLQNAPGLVAEVGYVPLPAADYEAELGKVR